MLDRRRSSASPKGRVELRRVSTPITVSPVVIGTPSQCRVSGNVPTGVTPRRAHSAI